jgi:hypothetical protein
MARGTQELRYPGRPAEPRCRTTPALVRMAHAVLAATRQPRQTSSSWILRWPQLGFSFACTGGATRPAHGTSGCVPTQQRDRRDQAVTLRRLPDVLRSLRLLSARRLASSTVQLPCNPGTILRYRQVPRRVT